MQLIAQTLLNEAFADGDSVATPQAFRALGPVVTSHLVEWGEGVSAGEVTIEKAANEGYTGRWSPVAVVTFDNSVDVAPKVEVVGEVATGLAYQHRITSPVEGGTVTTKISAAD
jgi:hypothetical protein